MNERELFFSGPGHAGEEVGGKRELVIGSHVGSKIVNLQKLLCAG